MSVTHYVKTYVMTIDQNVYCFVTQVVIVNVKALQIHSTHIKDNSIVLELHLCFR